MDNQDKAALLAQGIAKARMVMEKVEANTGGKMAQDRGIGSVSREIYSDEYQEREPEYLTEEQVAARTRSVGGGIPKNNMKNLATSKMPKEILQSFMENPIVDPTIPVGMDSLMEQVAKAQPKMKQVEEMAQPRAATPSPVAQPTVAPVMDTQLIEYIIKKTVETVLEEQSKKTSIDENFQIKIGEKVFGGKLNVLKENNNKTTTKK
jgi:hypothetical protein